MKGNHKGYKICKKICFIDSNKMKAYTSSLGILTY